MTSSELLHFIEAGPFDSEEKVTIQAVHDAIEAKKPGSNFAATVRRNVELISELSELLSRYPSVFDTHSLGKRQRNLESLIDMLSRANLSNFEVFLPTRTCTFATASTPVSPATCSPASRPTRPSP